jgi:ATP-binding protein involved in chromosome partitioning
MTLASFHDDIFVQVNLAFSLSLLRDQTSRRLRVGILDLDIFGPSVPTLMGLQHTGEPELTSGTSAHSHPMLPLSNFLFFSYSRRHTTTRKS